MNNEQKVYYGKYGNIGHCSIGTSIPRLIDYPAYYKAEIARRKDRNNPELSQKVKELNAHAYDYAIANQKFKKLEVLPDSLWVSNDNLEVPKDSDNVFSIINGGIVFRENVVNIFNQFRLGQTTLTPVKIHIIETGELWSDETFYFFNLCEQREYVCMSQPNNSLKTMITEKDKLVFTGSVKNSELLEVSKSALDCDVHIWHDPRYLSSLFMSDELYHALLDANLVKARDGISVWFINICTLV